MTADNSMQFVVRAVQSPATLDGAFRIHVLPEHLEQVGLNHGQLCEITSSEDPTTPVGYGLAWRATDRMGTNPKVRPAKTTTTLLNAFSIKEGSHINLARTTGKIAKAEKVVLTDITPLEYSSDIKAEVEDNKWKIRCHFLLANSEALTSGVSFDVNMKKGIRKRFYIESVGASAVQRGIPNLFYCDDETRIVIADSDASRPASAITGEFEDLLTTGYIGGLVEQLQALNESMKRVLKKTKPARKLSMNEGVLIHGFEGTGKSLILDRIARAGFQKAVFLNSWRLESESISKNKASIELLFKQAANNQPSVVLIDDLDKLAPSTNDVYGSTIAAEMDKINNSRVLVIATCRSLNDVESRLIQRGRFEIIVELPIPDMEARTHILNVMLDNIDDPADTIVKSISRRTHGFTGKDLDALVQAARRNARTRSERLHEEWVTVHTEDGSFEKLVDGAAHSRAAARMESEEKSNGYPDPSDSGELKLDDFEIPLQQMRPTALRELFFEKPQVQWSDIGGSQTIQARFDQIIEWPLRIPEKMAQRRLGPRKGVLLYGPPGCSKTLTAQAVATSYDLNFIVVRGAELNSMYVGESERSIREIFRKARTAAPSVIFFDEIDSIAADRETSGAKGLNVLTTLLNEMDGFESLRNVFVLAATNKPEILDLAIMRPGRFDSHIYLGPPNKAARKEILDIETRGIREDSVDLDALADATEGYSGAEIVAICSLAKEADLARDEAGVGASGPAIRIADLEEGLRSTKKGITAELLWKYAEFASKTQEM